MPNWSCKLTAASVDATGTNANVNLTFTATNSVTNEVQTRVVSGNNWTVAQVQVYAQSLIASLTARDTALPIAQAAVSAGTVLATG